MGEQSFLVGKNITQLIEVILINLFYLHICSKEGSVLSSSNTVHLDKEDLNKRYWIKALDFQHN